MYYERIKKAQQLLENGDCKESLAIFRQITNEAPENQEALIGMGYALYCLQEYEEAIQVLETMTRISPNNAEAHFLLGSTHFMSNHWEQARGHHFKASILEPSVAKYHLRLYADLHMLGEFEPALLSLETAYKLDTNILDAKGRWHLWRVRIFTGLRPVSWLVGWAFFGMLFTVGGLYGLNQILDWLGQHIPMAGMQYGQILIRGLLMSLPFVATIIYQLRKKRYRRAIWAAVFWILWATAVWYIPHQAGVW